MGVTNMVLFSTSSAQSDGVSRLKRFEFVFGDSSYYFKLNPDEYTQSEPARVQITQTKSGAWIDDFGAGIQLITMRGVTGFKNNATGSLDGFKKMKALRDLIRSVYDQGTPGEAHTSKTDELVFHNFTDGEHWIVVPKLFSLLRSAQRPLLYMYQIELACIRPATTPKKYGGAYAGIGKDGILPILYNE